MSNADLVAEFHRAIGSELPDRPTVPSLGAMDLRETLLREEFAEALTELDRVRARVADGAQPELPDLARLAHELVDLLYVTYGALLAFGIPADRVFGEVHRANLAKETGPTRADGKRMKPADWTPADVLAILQDDGATLC